MRVKAELTFPVELKEEPIICYVCKKFDVVVSILEASFSTDTGWAILIFEGAEPELQKAFTYLKDRGIRFEDTQNNP